MEPGGIIEFSDVVVVGNLAARVKDHSHDANGVSISTLLVARCVLDSAIPPPITTSCSSHTEACNEIGATDGITS